MISRSNIDVRIQIYQSEYQAIVAEARRFPNIETGGDLYGTFTHGSKPIIWLASGPGPNVRHEHSHFEQDSAFTTSWQKRLTKDFGIQYIGSWHSHHFIGLQRPSSGDIHAAQLYAREHNRQITIEIIVNHRLSNQQSNLRQLREQDFFTELRPYFYPNAQHAEEEGLVLANFVLLPGESPIRQHLGNNNLVSFGGTNWRQATGFRLPGEQTSQSSRGDTASEEMEIELPPELESELQSILNLDGIDVDIQQDSKIFMVIISLTRGPSLAIAVEKSRDPNIVRVDLIDKSQKTNKDITRHLEREIRLSLRHNGGVLKKIIRAMPSIQRQIEEDLIIEANELAAQRAEAQRIEAQRTEAQQFDTQRREVEQLAAQRREAQEQLDAQRREVQQLIAQRLEAQRQLEAQRLEAQRQLEAQRLEIHRLEAQQVTIQQRLEAQQQREARLLEAQQKLKTEQPLTDQQRLEAQQQLETRLADVQQQLEAERLAAQKLETQLMEAKEQLEVQRQLAAQLRETQERLDAQRRQIEQLEAQRSEAQQRLEAQRLEAQRSEAQRLDAQERLEAQRRQTEQLEAQLRTTQEQLEAQQRQTEQLEAQLRETQEQLDTQRKNRSRIFIRIRDGTIKLLQRRTKAFYIRVAADLLVLIFGIIIIFWFGLTSWALVMLIVAIATLVLIISTIQRIVSFIKYIWLNKKTNSS